MKSKFEYLKISIMSYFNSINIKFWEEDNVLYCTSDDVFSKHEKRINKIEDISASDFLEKIDAIDIPSWKKKYELNEEICDGMMWDLSLKYEDEEVMDRTGDNAWPENWNRLAELVKQLTAYEIA